MPNYFNAFNVFECGRKLLDRLDVSYERTCMATPKEEYYMDMLDNLNEHNRRHVQRLSSKNLQEAVIRVIKEEEEDAKSYVNNVTMDTSFQSPVATNVQNKYAKISLDRRLASGILAETIREFKGCKIKSTVSNYAQYDSNEQVDAMNDSDKQVDSINNPKELVDAGSNLTINPSSNPKVATHTTNRKSPQKLLRSWFVPDTI